MLHILIILLRDIADRLELGTCRLTEEEISESISALSQFDQSLRLNKDQACTFLNISRSTFDTYVRCGLIPKGSKIKGWKEKVWIKSDLIKYQQFQLNK